jgi:hypothetical protein
MLRNALCIYIYILQLVNSEVSGYNKWVGGTKTLGTAV